MSPLRALVCALAMAALWCIVVFHGALRGWWLEPVAPAGDEQAFAAAVAERVDAASPGSVAVGLIDDGELRTTHFRGVDRAVDERTRFPVASLGKWLQAYGVLLLAQDGRIDLDAPVSRYLRRWQLPPPAPGLDNDEVTVRRLLSHTAGLTDGLGFADHDDDAPPPTLLETLAAPRASSGEAVRLRIETMPGAEWAYSGGSYLILELLVEDVTGLSFESYMARAVFAPIGMARSSYAPLAALTDTSGSWTAEGTPAPLFRYAAKGATGLVTTLGDLVRFVRAQQTGAPLEERWVKTLREPQGRVFGQPIWGPGAMLYAEDGLGDFVYGHDGANDPSINATVRVDPSSGDGIVVLSTGPAFLASELGYEWVLWRRGLPDFLQTPRALRSALLPLLAGLALIVVACVAAMLGAGRRREG